MFPPIFSPELLAHYEWIASLPPTEPIPYAPASNLIAYNWTTATDVLRYLLLQPSDRLWLLNEAKRRNPNPYATFWVAHPLLKTLIKIRPSDTDEDLIDLIIALIRHIAHLQRINEMRRRRQYNTSPRLTSIIP
jgi:hypothetical protein